MAIILEGQLLTLIIFVIVMVFSGISMTLARMGKLGVQVQRIPAIESIDEAIERCVERGRPLLYLVGGTLSGRSAPTTFCNLDVVSRLAERLSSLGCPLLTAVSQAESISIATDTVRSGFTAGGHPEAFDVQDVRWWSDEWTSYYSGVLTWLYDRRPGAMLMMSGLGWGGAMISHDTHKIDCLLIGADVGITSLSLSYLGPDVLIMMEELYATAAYLTKDPVETSVLFTGDYVKFIWLALAILGVIAATAGSTVIANLFTM
ncbi:MAG: hypothetical protein JSV20_01110 [Candidatus Bathyarchaeota archaeon]|nr:MAG: hypothetical protein JSV20_01110 [Candidatus Bathyarchaeota archaeon]